MWKKTIAKYNLSGTHLLLTREQERYFNRLFSFSGIPHHVIIDRHGELYLNKAPGPRHGLREELEKLGVVKRR